MKNKSLLKLTLLLTSMMTMMAGAVVSPSLPQISKVFSEVKNIELLSRLIITLPAIFIALFSPIFGYLSDKLGRKKLLLLSLVCYSIGGASGYFLNNIYYILVGRALLGISVGGIMTIATTLIGDYFKGNERNKFAGLQGAFMGFGGVIFISIAGWFADIHWQMPFLIYLFAIPVLILGFIYLYEPKQIATEVTTINTSKYNKKLANIIYILIFLGILFFYMVPVQIPFLLGNFGDISYSKIGYAIGISTLSSAIVSMKYGRIKSILSFKSILQIAFITMGIGYLIIFFSESYFQVLIGLFTSGIGTGLLMPTGNLWIMSIAPEKIRGTLVGKVSMATYLGQFFSPILIQPIINNFNVEISFLCASISLSVISITLFSLKSNN
jgi:MFS family permease